MGKLPSCSKATFGQVPDCIWRQIAGRVTKYNFLTLSRFSSVLIQPQKSQWKTFTGLREYQTKPGL